MYIADITKVTSTRTIYICFGIENSLPLKFAKYLSKNYVFSMPTSSFKR